MLEHREDLSTHTLKEFIVSENIRCTKGPDLIRELLAWLGKHVSLEASVHIELDVCAVLFGYFHVHLHVIFILWVFLLVRMEKVLILFQILDDFTVHADVLQRAVNNDKDFHVNGPIVEV